MMKKIISLLSIISILFLFQNCGDLDSVQVAEIGNGLYKENPKVSFLSKASSRNEVVLFRSLSDKNRRYFYRIPSMVVVNSEQYLVAFAEQRVASNQDSGDINVVYRISYDHGRTWSRIHKACELSKDTCGNPTTVVDQKRGIIHLFMNANPGDKSQFGENKFGVGDRRVLYRQAKFRGKQLEFSEIEDLTNMLQPRGMKMDLVGPGVGIQLSEGRYKGRLIIPAARRAFISDDGGKSWRLSKLIMPNLSSESSLMELDDGNIIRNDRATAKYKSAKRRVLSYSKDGADSFSNPSVENSLYDPVAQGSMLRYSKGNMFMANCASTVRRRFLTIRRTEDGESWISPKRIDANCGYSSMAKTRDFHLSILYERRSSNAHLWAGKVPQDLIFKKFKLKDLK